MSAKPYHLLVGTYSLISGSLCKIRRLVYLLFTLGSRKEVRTYRIITLAYECKEEVFSKWNAMKNQRRFLREVVGASTGDFEE